MPYKYARPPYQRQLDTGPNRPRTRDEIALYAQYRDARANFRPRECTGTSPCWVEDGPLGLNGNRCRGCDNRPDAPLSWRGRVQR
jgi:hypothetical protein